MNSLFAKILLWFWTSLVIFVVGSALISALSSDVSDRHFPLARMAAFQEKEAVYAYENEGRAGLQAYMDRLESVYRGRAFLTDASGRDLLTGEDRSRLLHEARGRDQSALFRPGGMLVARQSENGRYWYFVFVPRLHFGTWFLLREHWWGLAVGVLLCWVLAYHLTSPVRKLQHAVEAFGRGDLSARARSRRNDELGQLARTFDAMADRTQTLLEAERRLLRDISHELRSPLARLGVAIELARDAEQPANRQAALDRIAKESERLNTLVRELLEVTRVEGDPNALRAEPVRLDNLLREIAGDVQIEAEARGSRVELRAVEPRTISGDPELLRRAVENIVRNAIRFAPEGTPVEMAMEARNGRTVVCVRDYGPGVPAESLPRIFDAFYRVESDRDRATGGVGLGLSIARRAVEAHHGKLTARNANPGLAVELEL
ncbi:MAG: sensor histidine kinase [Bryobacteraceae bacterium]